MYSPANQLFLEGKTMQEYEIEVFDVAVKSVGKCKFQARTDKMANIIGLAYLSQIDGTSYRIWNITGEYWATNLSV